MEEVRKKKKLVQIQLILKRHAVARLVTLISVTKFSSKQSFSKQ